MLTGGVTGVLVMAWLSFEAQFAIASGNIKIVTKELAADNCPYTFTLNQTSSILDTPTEEYIFPLYKISYMWYTAFAAIVTMLVAITCSALIFGWNDPKSIAPELISPAVRRRIYKKPENITRPSPTIKDTEF